MISSNYLYSYILWSQSGISVRGAKWGKVRAEYEIYNIWQLYISSYITLDHDWVGSKVVCLSEGRGRRAKCCPTIPILQFFLALFKKGGSNGLTQTHPNRRRGRRAKWRQKRRHWGRFLATGNFCNLESEISIVICWASGVCMFTYKQAIKVMKFVSCFVCLSILV